ncbi:MAG TPA: hypothetical protein VD813_00165 [Pseudonocardia sp.]|nr:hypothetical protein [Pseudonocardia sp.]
MGLASLVGTFDDDGDELRFAARPDPHRPHGRRGRRRLDAEGRLPDIATIQGPPTHR